MFSEDEVARIKRLQDVEGPKFARRILEAATQEFGDNNDSVQILVKSISILQQAIRSQSVDLVVRDVLEEMRKAPADGG